MALKRTLTGDGAILHGGKETPVSYRIEAVEDANRRRADGSAEGIALYHLRAEPSEWGDALLSVP